MKFQKDYSRKSFDSRLLSYVSFIKEDLLKSYESSYASLLLPNDSGVLKDVSLLVKKKKGFSHIVVIGIGGSNLGALSILEAIEGKNYLFNKKKFFFADTVDVDNLDFILKQCKNKKTLLILISKSGSTVESLANFEVLASKLKSKKDDVVVITDKDSKLYDFAKQKNYDFLLIPKNVGGRYSVFSAVGLFPLALAGIKIKELLKGAGDSLKNFNKKNIALNGALDLFHNYGCKKSIYDLFIFSNDLESLGKWYRQLLAESVGKKYLLTKKIANVGMTPMVSIGSTDLHSVGQLYFGGPRDKFTSFLSVADTPKVIVPKNKRAILKDLQGLTFKEIKDAILKGTMSAFKKNKLPFNHYELKSKTEYELGYFMQTKMLETIFFAHLLQVDPFDQPSVEEYKKETRKILSR